MRGLEDYQVSDGTVDVQHGDSRVGNADAGRDHVGKDGDGINERCVGNSCVPVFR